MCQTRLSEVHQILKAAAELLGPPWTPGRLTSLSKAEIDRLAALRNSKEASIIPGLRRKTSSAAGLQPGGVWSGYIISGHVGVTSGGMTMKNASEFFIV